MAEEKKAKEMTGQQLVDYAMSMKQEADTARRTRMELNEDNYEMFHLRHNFKHKKKGQSQEVLSKQSMAVEQTASFFQQALTDLSDWWAVELRSHATPEEMMKIRPHEMKKLTDLMLQKNCYYNHVGNSVKSGLLGSLIITKTAGKLCPKPKYKSRKEGKGKNLKRKLVLIEDETWELKQSIIRQENYYPDPTGAGLYEIEVMYCDLWEVLEKAEGDEAIYDKDAVEGLSREFRSDFEEQQGRSRETGQDVHTNQKRPRVKLTEFWGTVLDPASGRKLYENVVYTVANDKHLIRKPTPNPLWHQKSPYTVTPLIEVPGSVWHKALMDAPTKHNRALIEIYNLILDSAMKAVHGVTQIRTDALEDPSQVVDGIPFGTALQVNSSLPAGAKVIEQVITGDVPKDALDVMNVVQNEFNSSALTNDVRQGMLGGNIRATAVVEASQQITSIFTSLAKNLEQKKIVKDLEMAWATIAQNLDLIDEEELIGLFGEQRGRQIAALAPEDVFAETVQGCRFVVYGITQTLSKAQDFRKLTTLLQTIGSSEVLLEEFVRKYDFGKLLGEVMTSLDIDKHKIELPVEAQSAPEAGPEGQAGPGEEGDQMSQVPEAAGAGGGGGLAALFQAGLGAGGPQSGGQSGGNPVL